MGVVDFSERGFFGGRDFVVEEGLEGSFGLGS